MRFSTFMVVLDPEQPVYIPGQIVEGYLRVDSPQDVACKRITVTFKGQAKVVWSEGSGKTRRLYKANEIYFRRQVTVWNGEGARDTMGPGDHRFSFSFILPQDIPSSFTSCFGNVIYHVKAEAVRPWSTNQKHKVFLSVNFLYDLNIDPFAVKPMRLEEETTACCWCCAQGPIDLRMAAERSGYVPGETIVLNGEVVNHSKSTIKYTEIKLIQVITFMAESRKTTVERTVERVYHPKLEAGGRDTWSSVPLPIPAVPASHLAYCSIINMNYLLVVKAKFGACRDATAAVPVIIGALPLRTTYSTFVPQPVSAPSGGTTMTYTTSPGPWPGNVYPHNSSASSHPPSAPPQEPCISDPPPYSASFLPDKYRDVPSPSYADSVFDRGMKRRVVKNGAKNKGVFVPNYIIYKTQT